MRKLSILFFILLINCNQINADIRIQNCEGPARRIVERASKFIKNNINEIIADKELKNLSKREIKRYKKQVKSLNIKCSDKKRRCKKNSKLLGFAKEIGKTVNLCFNNIVRRLDSYCGLLGILAHEAAHAARVRDTIEHKPYTAGDLVYAIGRSAENECLAKDFDRPRLVKMRITK